MTRENLDMTLKIVGVLIALFGVWKFFDDRARERVQQEIATSLKYIEVYEEERVSTIRKEIRRFWVGKEPILGAFELAGGVGNRNYRNFVATALNVYPRSTDIIDALINMDSFFAQLEFCIQFSRCNKQLILEFFCPRALRVDAVYQPFYGILGEVYKFKTVGQGILKFAGRCRNELAPM